MTWSGSGSYQAAGGTWNGTDKTFTVAATTMLSAGASDTVTTGERLLFTDSITGRRVGASFGTVSGSINFSAAPMSADAVDDLLLLLASNDKILGAWDFTTNYSNGGDVLMSFDVGPGFDDLSIWHLQGGAWQSYDPALLSYAASGLANFTVNSFSGYAVTTAIPEPAALALMVTVGAWFSLRRRDRVDM